MSHPQQISFCKKVKAEYPHYFKNVQIVDVGSLDINGNNRILFTEPFSYIGIDLIPGKNVDVIGRAHEVIPTIEHSIKGIGRSAGIVMNRDTRVFDIIISTECLEHDRYFDLTLIAMYKALKPGGLLLITAAGEGRAEHGTTLYDSRSSPATNDYYRNITNEMFISVLPPILFSHYCIKQFQTDFQFYGLKKDY